MGISLFMPGRATRRKLAGLRCVMCDLGVVAGDLAIASFDDEERVIHQQCSGILIEMLTKEAEADDNTAE